MGNENQQYQPGSATSRLLLGGVDPVFGTGVGSAPAPQPPQPGSGPSRDPYASDSGQPLAAAGDAMNNPQYSNSSTVLTSDAAGYLSTGAGEGSAFSPPHPDAQDGK